MKYLILIYGDAARWDHTMLDVRESGELVAGGVLADRVTTMTVRDGLPYPGTTAQISGYLVIDCGSRARASEIAARLPAAATVEVRPIMDAAGQEM